MQMKNVYLMKVNEFFFSVHLQINAHKWPLYFSFPYEWKALENALVLESCTKKFSKHSLLFIWNFKQKYLGKLENFQGIFLQDLDTLCILVTLFLLLYFILFCIFYLYFYLLYFIYIFIFIFQCKIYSFCTFVYLVCIFVVCIFLAKYD